MKRQTRRETCSRIARGRALLACFLIFGVAAPLGLAQSPPMPQPDPAPVPQSPKPAPTAPSSPPVVSTQQPEPVVRERPPKKKRTRKPDRERVFLNPIHAPDPGPAPAAVPAAASPGTLPVFTMLAILAGIGALMASLGAAPAWALVRISSSLARRRTDIALMGFVLLACLAGAYLVTMA